MSNYILWHNPRCSKSRQALALLTERGVEFGVRHYLDESPDAAELTTLLGALGLTDTPWALVRTKEAIAKELGVKAWQRDGESTNRWVEAMVAHPKLIERPILVAGDRAVIGRPPEEILGLI